MRFVVFSGCRDAKVRQGHCCCPPSRFPLPSLVCRTSIASKKYKTVGCVSLVNNALGTSSNGLDCLATEGGYGDGEIGICPNLNVKPKPMLDDLVVTGTGVYGNRGR